MTEPTIAQRLRTMPQPVAIRYAEGLESLFWFNPALRRLYAPADLAYIDHLARLGEGVSHYAKGFDPNQPRDDDGQWSASPWASKKDIESARKSLGKGKLPVKTGSTESAASGRKIKKYVELPNGAKIHPDELHRAKFDDDDEPYISDHEALTVMGSSGHREVKSFALAVARAGLSKGFATIQGPHGYSITLPGSEWKKVKPSGKSFAEWSDDQDPEDLKKRQETGSLASIGSAKDTDDFFAGRDNEQPRLFSKGSDGRWITIGGKKGEGGERHGGSPVYIEDGKITKGAPALTGKKIAALDEKAEGQSVRKANTHEKEYGRAKWAKEARNLGVNPADLHQLSAEFIAHDAENKSLVRQMIQTVRARHPKLKTLSLGRGDFDHTSVPGFDLTTKELVYTPEYGHLFGSIGGYDSEAPDEDHTQRMWDYVMSGNPEPMSEEDAYEQAMSYLLERQAIAAHAEEDVTPFSKPDLPGFYNKAFDPNQPRDQKGRWTTESTAELLRTAKTLEPHRNTPLADADIQNALAVWDHLQHDYGTFAPLRVSELAKRYAKNRKALAVLGWMANRMVG